MNARVNISYSTSRWIQTEAKLSGRYLLRTTQDASNTAFIAVENSNPGRKILCSKFYSPGVRLLPAMHLKISTPPGKWQKINIICICSVKGPTESLPIPLLPEWDLDERFPCQVFVSLWGWKNIVNPVAQSSGKSFLKSEELALGIYSSCKFIYWRRNGINFKNLFQSLLIISSDGSALLISSGTWSTTTVAGYFNGKLIHFFLHHKLPYCITSMTQIVTIFKFLYLHGVGDSH